MLHFDLGLNEICLQGSIKLEVNIDHGHVVGIPLSKQVMASFTDTYMRHSVTMS